ncbi:MAG: dienelactone hydrolase family protein [Dehalococcoidales bacterium]|nr:dienelactone hydrolase family protein [Dehalococcoidales bacterium]
MKSIHVRFPVGDITLEGEWHLPEGQGPFPAVVVCHPHPLYGGNMENNVVVAIWETLPQYSIAAFRFNFRGVGGSEGKFGGGIAEREDVKAALTFISSSSGIDANKIGLAGYSFGAGVALAVASRDERVSSLALVSPARFDSRWGEVEAYKKPKLLIVGDADSVIPLEPFLQHIKVIANPGQYQIIPGADHFWSGFEDEVARRVAEFFTAGFKQL